MKKAILLVIILEGLIINQIFPQPTADPAPNQGNLTGFDGIQWGTSYKEVKDRLRNISSSPDVSEPVNIIADMPGREIRISRKNIVYRYVFYAKPEIIAESDVKSSDQTNPADNVEKSTEQNRLFFVESTFSYVPAGDLEKKIGDKYGVRTGGMVDQNSNRGYYLWSFQRGFLIQWIDPYKQKPFTRSLYYASKDIIEEIKADYGKFQYTREIKTLMNILY